MELDTIKGESPVISLPKITYGPVLSSRVAWDCSSKLEVNIFKS